MKKIHMICNAHLDPVWLWQWEEGLGEALSTFRIAADFCEQYDGFIFNHNEAVLYEWIEEYEPALFARIQKLVKEKKWHIMGGWYLQPDCNMPSGESFARQMIYGKKYFKDKFGVEPKTAINFDPFGHSRGLVQIMKKAGYHSYLFCRPEPAVVKFPGEDFLWEGVDGSTIKAHRSYRHYLSGKGKSVDKVKGFMEDHPEKQEGLILWGIGNHGGGPSKLDLERINGLMEEKKDEYEIIHSIPETYFESVTPEQETYKKSIQPFAVGCYTSQIRIKQKHAQLENMLYSSEKMMSAATLNGLMTYDDEKSKSILKDLMFSQFHDILPGSSIQIAEEDAIRQMDRGLQNASELKAKAFYMMLSGQEKAKEGHLPIFVYNPHPYPINDTFECEYMNEFIKTRGKHGIPHVYQDGQQIDCQDETEASGLHALDWRKKVVFKGQLKPFSMNRFDLKLEEKDKKPKIKKYEKNGYVQVKTDDLEIKINQITGLVDLLKIQKTTYIKENGFMPTVMKDDADAWGMMVDRFEDVEDRFRLMTQKEAKTFANVDKKTFQPVRVVEDGPVRTMVEVYMKYQDSKIILTYLIPKKGTDITVKARVYWNETDKMLKLAIPTTMKKADFMGQIACGTESLKSKGEETVAQKWVALVDDEKAFGILKKGLYGQSCKKGTIYLSLLRSPAYSGHPKNNYLIDDDRYYPRIDQGERMYTFKLMGGEKEQILNQIDRDALSLNENPYVLTAYPSGQGEKAKTPIEIKGNGVMLQAFLKEQDSEDYVVRLFNPLDKETTCTLISECFQLEQEITFGKYELKTFRVDQGKMEETNLLGE